MMKLGRESKLTLLRHHLTYAALYAHTGSLEKSVAYLTACPGKVPWTDADLAALLAGYDAWADVKRNRHLLENEPTNGEGQ